VVRSCLNPEQPNNDGFRSPSKVEASKGSIVNADYPSPLNARHFTGMFVPMPILKALHQVMSDRILAEGSRAFGRRFASSMFDHSGGMGGRLTKPDPAATCGPV
jgi:N-methylhydantoinase B/oxoprolinase/acetone carboxylase alpha subunit